MNENKAMRSPDALRKILEIRQQRADRQLLKDIKISVNAERDRRWREDPLGLMPYLRFEGLRCMVADGLRAIADWVEG